jgi:multidrug efflux pump subunit AcrA (membrane-fusion protein)
MLMIAAAAWAAFSAPASAADILTVQPITVGDEKAVFATVESANVVPARARIGGTVARLAVTYGDHVERGQTLAAIGDEKLILQMKSLDAQIAALDAQLAQAHRQLLDGLPQLVRAEAAPGPVALEAHVVRLLEAVDGVVEDVAQGSDRHHRPPRDADAPRRNRSTTGSARLPTS